MTHQEGFFKGPHDSRIYYQAWLPETPPKAVLLIVHGLAEHCGRYMNVVNHFVPLGYAVYGFDHLGHGKSDGPRVYVERFQDFLDTIKTYYDMIQAWQPGKPIFLVGHSMGGLISAVYLLDHQQDFAGAVLSGASVKVPDHISGATIMAGKVFSKLLPKFGILKLEADGVSRDPAVVQAYINDPLVCTGKITARLAGELLGATQRVTVEAEKITLPILILHGGADKLVECDASKTFYDRIRSAAKTLKIYPGLYHEVFNEPERGMFSGDVEGWVEERLNFGHRML
jgi:alpha-beta hydrolase superfamily lysophospholipase